MPPGTPPIKPPLHPQNPYMDMSSPVTTSSWASPPASAHDGYLPMYSSGSAPGSVGTLFGTHTRSSSFWDKPPESYVPMTPQSVASSVTSRDEEGGSYMICNIDEVFQEKLIIFEVDLVLLAVVR